MDWNLFAGLLALVVGAIICFGGYRFFRFLMVVVGFGTGFVLGALAVALFTKTQLLSGIWGWVAAIGAGLVLAVLAWPFYAAGIAILGAAAGYLIGSGVMVYLSFGTGYLTQGVGVGAGLVLVILLFVFRVHRAVVMIYTALAGGAIILGGALFLAGQLPYASKTGYDPTPLLRDQPIWLLLWAGASLVGLGTQWASRPRVPKPTASAQPAPTATGSAAPTAPLEPAPVAVPPAETTTPAPEPAPSSQPPPPPQQAPAPVPPPRPGGGSQVAPTLPPGTPAPPPPPPQPPPAQPGAPPPAHTPPPSPPGQPGAPPPPGPGSPPQGAPPERPPSG